MQAHGETLGPLHGLPVAHKDLIETAGIRTTFGSSIYKDNVPTEDNLLVTRMREAGAISLGKTNTPEFGAGSQTFNRVFGATHNPYDLRRPAAAPPAAQRSRSPAVWCPSPAVLMRAALSGTRRLVQHRRLPPFHRPRAQPAGQFGWSTLSTNGCLGRSVADLALALSTIAGPDTNTPLAIHEPGSLFRRPLDRSFKGVRVAWFKDLNGIPIDPRVRTAVDAHRTTFESLGCIVEQAEPDFAPAEISFRILRSWNAAAAYGKLFQQHPDAFKDTLDGEIKEGLKFTASDITRAEIAHTRCGAASRHS